VLTVREGSRAIKGYGSVHIPTTPGTHVRYCKLFIPCSSTRVQSVVSTLTNEPPEVGDLSYLFSGNLYDSFISQNSSMIPDSLQQTMDARLLVWNHRAL